MSEKGLKQTSSVHLRLKSPTVKILVGNEHMLNREEVTVLLDLPTPWHVPQGIYDGTAVEMSRAEAFELHTLLGMKLGIKVAI